MTELNKGTQRAQGFIASYKSALLMHGARTIDEAYNAPSKAKRLAWEYCVILCRERHGKGLTVVGVSCYKFTAAFTFEEGGKKFLCYITRGNDYKIAL